MIFFLAHKAHFESYEDDKYLFNVIFKEAMQYLIDGSNIPFVMVIDGFNKANEELARFLLNPEKQI